METVLTCIQDEFPKLRKYKSHMCIGLGIICFFLALPCVTPVSKHMYRIGSHLFLLGSVDIWTVCSQWTIYTKPFDWCRLGKTGSYSSTCTFSNCCKY